MRVLLMVLISINLSSTAYTEAIDFVDISEEGIQLVCQFEGFKEHPYLDSGGVPTIGFGTILYDDNTRVSLTDPPITESRAAELLEHNMKQKCDVINKLVTVSITQNQFDALCSFTYNLGSHALATSTLLHKLNNNDVQGAADEFMRWVHNNGKIEVGLINRRKDERNLFLKGLDDVRLASNP